MKYRIFPQSQDLCSAILALWVCSQKPQPALTINAGVNFSFARKRLFLCADKENPMHKCTFVFSLVLVSVLAPFCSSQAAQPRRPMTFEDMMKMKRLGETAVSPDGKWLAYSVTTVNLEENTKTAELWLQPIAGGEPIPIAVAKPADGGPQFAPDGRSVLFLSGRDGGQQIWLADFDPATGAASNAKRLTSISTE